MVGSEKERGQERFGECDGGRGEVDFGWEVGRQDVEFKNLWAQGRKEGYQAIVDFWRGGRWCWHGDSRFAGKRCLKDCWICTP